MNFTITSDRSTPHRLGRPRDPGLTDRLMTATLDLVAEHGVDALTTDALTASVGAGKAAVYRRWPNTDVLLAEALGRCRPVPSAQNTGSLRDDLIALLEPWTHALGRDELALAAVLGRARQSPHLRSALEVAVVLPLDSALTVVLDRHGRRGHEVPATRQLLLRRLVLALWWERYASDPTTIEDAGVVDLVDKALLPIVVRA